ncbi:MAG: hypothetical protein ACLVD8_25870 [Enterocloster sp.]|uniref:hypothetical protein n=1 Tax=Enterocloster sp. TaxID=2719315 RepID=UPI0039998DBE
MLCEVPLTKEQQEFAAEHHGLVYKFLNDNHLSEDEFYDVVIFPYLTAVGITVTVRLLRSYSFSTIAMRQRNFGYVIIFRAQERHKRNAEILSIHLGLYPDGTPLEDTLAVQDKLMQEFEMGQLLHDLAGRISRQQMNIVRMKGCGYGVREIAKSEKLPVRCIKDLLEEAHAGVSGNSAASNLPRQENQNHFEWRSNTMTKSKKSIAMHGTLRVPAGSGPLRFSACQRHHLPTSTVVAIHEQSADMIHFETLNSDYYLSMDPFPMAAVFRLIRPWPRARRIQQVRGNAP